MIGVAPSTFNKSADNYTKCGFYIYSNSGGKYSQNGDGNAAYTRVSCNSAGTHISVRLNCDNHTLEFAVNGKWYGVAYNNLPNVELFPAVEFSEPGAKVSLSFE